MSDSPSPSIRHQMVEMVQSAQTEICQALAKINGRGPIERPWVREEGGGGVACIFSDGEVLEKGGVNVSTVHGRILPAMAQAMQFSHPRPHELSFFATGISLVLHPYSPMIPTVHLNTRYFEIEENGKTIDWYFGGGSDLTPYYLFEEDSIHFHTVLKDFCDKSDSTLYRKLKKDADKYFYLPHRQEHRGVGGIFSLKYTDRDPEQIFSWSRDCAQSFIPSYLPIVEKRMKESFGEAEQKWQHIRRGRYVEFNLMYDIGTTFGLKSNGHIENILMSLPPHVCWEYDFNPKAGSPEAKLMETIKTPREWI